MGDSTKNRGFYVRIALAFLIFIVALIFGSRTVAYVATCVAGLLAACALIYLTFHTKDDL